MSTAAQSAGHRAAPPSSALPGTPVGRRAASFEVLPGAAGARSVVLPGENQAEFDALFASYVATAQARTPSEMAAIRRIAVSEWRLRRLALIETQMLSRLAAEPASPGEDPLDVLAGKFLDGGFSPIKALSQLESALLRQYREAWKEIDRARAARTPDPDPPPKNSTNEPNLAPAPPAGGPAAPGLSTPSASPTPSVPAIPRSAPCPCGSQLKFKRCCGRGAPGVLNSPAANKLPRAA